MEKITEKRNPSNYADEDIAICFGSLRLNSKCDALSVDPLPVPESSGKLQETQVVKQETKGSSAKFDNSLATVQEFIPGGGAQWPSSSFVPQENIWAFQNSAEFENNAEGNSVTPPNHAPVDYVLPADYVPDDTRFDLYGENFGAYGLNGDGDFSSVLENQFSGNLCGSGYDGTIPGGYQTISPYFQEEKIWNYGSPVENFLPGFDFYEMAMSKENSEQLKRVLRQGYSQYTMETLKSVLPHIFELMNDFVGHRIFDALVDTCPRIMLYAILLKFESESNLFLISTLYKIGSMSIQRLIKRIKKTGLESIITLILSTSSIYLMTDKIASHVIQSCFMYLGEKANQVLYDDILNYFLQLATHPVGCFTINACIDSITGPKRALLLDLVAGNAVYLSNDPSGNYVLQRVLGLKYDYITKEICLNLRGQYVELARRKSGSHVVEKCLESSALGLTLVVNEIFCNDKTIAKLARDQFGNFVMQAALRICKVQNKSMYEAIVGVLRPHYADLMTTPTARYITNLIKADIEGQQQRTENSDQ